MFRLPTSLHWLIEKRGRIDGSIQKIERYLDKHRKAFEKYQGLANDLALLKETLASVDKTLQLHKIQVDPQFIPTIHGRNYVTDLQHGELTRSIYERLDIGNDQPVSSKEIVDFIIERRKAQGKPPVVRAFLSHRVYKQLKNLHWRGKVVRHHPQKTNHCGWWTLATSSSLSTQSEVDALENTP
jgi:hypothetical protein